MALLVALSVVVLLSVAAYSWSTVSLSRYRRFKHVCDSLESALAAQTGVVMAEAVLSADERPFFALPRHVPDYRRHLLGLSPELASAYETLCSTSGFEVGGWRVRLCLFDESARVSLDDADFEFLRNLFSLLGLKAEKRLELLDESVEEDMSARLAACIVDWRDTDSNTFPVGPGAESASYAAADLGYEPRDSFFHSIHELRYLPVWKPGFWKRVSPYLTVVSRVRGVNVNTAPPLVLRAVPGVFDSPDSAAVVARILASRPFTDRNGLAAFLQGQLDASDASRALAYLRIDTSCWRVVVRKGDVSVGAVIAGLSGRWRVGWWEEGAARDACLDSRSLVADYEEGGDDAGRNPRCEP